MKIISLKFYLLFSLLSIGFVCKGQFNTVGFNYRQPIVTHNANNTNNKDDAIVDNRLERLLEIYNYEINNYAYPLNDFQITSNFGYRTHPIKKIKHYHSGVDLVSDNDTVRSVIVGEVIKVAHNKGYGYHIKIRGLDDAVYTYAHLNKILVYEGQIVSSAETIGIMGNTGVSTGKHLHFEVAIQNKRVNPISYINKKTQNYVL